MFYIFVVIININAMGKTVTAYLVDGDKLIMASDKTFSSASTAASFCLGRSANGWTEWKDKDGNTLDSVYRKQLE